MNNKKYTAADMTSATLWGALFTLTTLIIINQYLGA
jgi:membrane protein DedA with SNARE-associated domain|tara:strand:- start:131 stop:238 length:108 start_codon:yes stop_codon:yes gene_type:complete